MIGTFVFAFILGALSGYFLSLLTAKKPSSQHICGCGEVLEIKFDGRPIKCKCGKIRVFNKV